MKKISLFKPYMSVKSAFYVVKTLFSGQLAEGPKVRELEEMIEKKFNLSNVVLLNSGTSALELAYELADIKEGDEVISPVLTCTATNIPLVRRGAKIVFADISNDLNINVDDIKNKITSKTKAIVFVHFGGNNRGLKEIIDMAKDKNIVVIEDAAQAIASDFWGQADFTCVSLQAVKTLTSGDGGFLVCKDSIKYKEAKKLRWFGYDREKKQALGDIDLDLAGYKYHMNDITASIGLGNLSVIEKVFKHNKKLAQKYTENGFTAYPWFALTFTDDRAGLDNFLKSRGIFGGVYHYRNDKYTLFGGRRNDLPVMDSLEEKYFLLPLHYGVSKKDVNFICKTVGDFNNIKSVSCA